MQAAAAHGLHADAQGLQAAAAQGLQAAAAHGLQAAAQGLQTVVAVQAACTGVGRVAAIEKPAMPAAAKILCKSVAAIRVSFRL